MNWKNDEAEKHNKKVNFDDMITWNKLIDRNYWTLRLSKVTLGKTEITMSSYKAIIDTGTSNTALPTADFKALMGAWTDVLDCGHDIAMGFYYCNCNVNEWKKYFPPL